MKKSRFSFGIVLFIFSFFLFNSDVYAAKELTCLYEKGGVEKVVLQQDSSGKVVIYKNKHDVGLDGKISDIKTDDILGNVIEIDHDNEIKTVYQSVDNIKVKVGDEVKQGDVIATSGTNKLNNTNKNCLLFEVYQKGQLVNPEKMFETKALEQ